MKSQMDAFAEEYSLNLPIHLFSIRKLEKLHGERGKSNSFSRFNLFAEK